MTFKLIETRSLTDIQSTGKLYQHEETGAKVLRIENDDPNRAFTIGFKTPPYNDNGIAHILEHSVLNGSKKYPSKEPFVELIKGSLNTFVNAMTFSDKTIYPIASTNQQDFENLMSVYLDAVFQPKLYTDNQILQQEGWHYHLEKPEDDLLYKGVVYNEMKGATASAEQRLYFEIVKALYPNTLYAYESGGLPSAIPSLTQEEFIEFHQKYYHPSQSMTVLYGDLDDDKAFSMLEEYFEGAGRDAEQVDLGIDVPFVKNANIETTYSITDGEDPTDKDYLALAWHSNVAEDILEGFALDVVMDVLFGNNQAPVKKALLEAGIAGDISADRDQIGYFSMINIVAKYSSVDKLKEFENIVMNALQKVVDEGVEKELIEAALNQIAFRQKELVISESNPRGVLYAMKAFQTWLYDFNPMDNLEFDRYLSVLREKFENGYFEELVQIYLLENDHRATVSLKADPGLNDRQEQALHESLQAFKANLSEAEISELVATTQALIERQSTPDTAEDLAKIPALAKEDLTTETEEYPLEVATLSKGNQFYHAPQFTAGIDYLDILFNIEDFTADDFIWLNLLSRLLGKLPTKHYSSKELLTKIDLYTGGVGGAVQVYEQESDNKAYFVVRGKALEEMDNHLIELMHELTLHTQFDDVEEIIKIVQRAISGFENKIDYQAHALASQRALSQVNATAKLVEIIGGIDQYRFLKDILKQLKSENAHQVVEKLVSLYRRIGNQTRLNVFYIGDEERKVHLANKIETTFADLPIESLGDKQTYQPGVQQKEAFVTAQDVNYVGLAAVLPEAFKLSGEYHVLGKALRYDYLWNNIRVKGGAYGAMYNLRRNGSLTLASYRDPNITQTLNVYHDIPRFIEQLEINEMDLLKYMIGTMSDLNQPMSAADKGNMAFVYYHIGVDQAERKQIKEEVLATTIAKLHRLRATYQTLLQNPAIAVIGNKAQIEAVKEQFDVIHELY